MDVDERTRTDVDAAGGDGELAVRAEEPLDPRPPASGRSRARRALKARHNWVQLARFCAVGASGYAVNLAVYSLALQGGVHYRLAATISFVVAATNNYAWNRLWTFRRQRGHIYYQGLRFFVVSATVYAGNLLLLELFVRVGTGKIVAQALAILLVTPANFIGNKLWSFRR
ncbi:MAG: GtrA family protein [Gaiellaceae bacterium]